MKFWLRIFLLNTLLLTVLTILVLLVVRQEVTSSLRSEQSRYGLTLARNLADRIADQVVQDEPYQTEAAIAASLKSDSDLLYAFVIGMDGKLFAHTFGSGVPAGLAEWNPTGNKEEAIQLLATEVGTIRDVGVKIFSGLPAELHLGLKETRISVALERLRNRIVVGSGIAIVCALFISLLFNRYLAQPLNHLIAHGEALIRGEFGKRVGLADHGELGALAATFDTLSQELADSRQRAEESMRQMLRTEKLSALGQLSAGLAHEIRNPLTSIKILFQSFLESSPPTRKDIEVVLSETERMETLLKQFLAFTHIEEATPQAVDLPEVAHHVLYICRYQMQRQGIEVAVEFASMPSVMADRGMIEQVLLNLIMNAVEAMPEGGELHISGGITADNRVEIKVRDSGGGIPEAVRDKIFDPFFTTKPEGTGLGLSVIHNIVGHFGGTIDFQCDTDGTTFMVMFPVASEPHSTKTGVANEP